jgi:DeoR family fructose operon transcriptional repressor
MGSIHTRKEQILNLLLVDEEIRTEALVRELHVSEATVRRTLNEMQQDGKVIRTHGGVKLNRTRSFDYVFEQKFIKNVPEKKSIGRMASSLLTSHDSVFFDSGTTVFHAAEAVANRLRAGQLKKLKVVTHSLIVAEVLGDLCEVILLGGAVRLYRMDCHGPVVEKYLQMFKADKAFIGADGISLKDGLMTTDEHTAMIAEMMIKQSSTVYLLVDSSKFENPSFINIVGLDNVDFIITDDKLTGTLQSKYEKQDIKILTASRNGQLNVKKSE